MSTLSVHASVVVELRDGETVLEGLYRDGYAYRVGCRRGGCGVCKVDLVSGSVRYPKAVSQNVLTHEERRDGTCLSCRAVPEGDVTIALREDRLTRNPLLAWLGRPSTTSDVANENRQDRHQLPHGEGDQL